MDLFNGAVGTNQVHDFNPGIRESGLFWTVPVSEDDMAVDLDKGTATLALHHFDTDDYGNLRNALTDGPEVDATISFHMKWKATGDPFSVSDSVHTFRGQFSFATVAIEWNATVPSSGFSFASDPSTNVTVKGVIGSEKNGIFF